MSATVAAPVNRIGWRFKGPALPVSCIFCRTRENTFLVTTNHGASMGYARGDRVCLAMYLRRNHVKFAASPERGSSDEAARQLEEYLARAAEIWRDMSWAAYAYERLAHLRALSAPPEHHVVAASEQEALL